MMETSESSSEDEDRSANPHHGPLFAELESLRGSYATLQAEIMEKEERLVLFMQQKEEAIERSTNLVKALEEALNERNALREELVSFKEKEEDLSRKIEEDRKDKEEIRSEKNRILSQQSEAFGSVRECLIKLVKALDGDGREEVIDEQNEGEISENPRSDEELNKFALETVSRIAEKVEIKLKSYQEKCKKEKSELENSVKSLTEENRDVNSLLRIALVEKEAMEKSLNRLKGNHEQKGVSILQIAGRGLQKVGFGFMMGTGASENSVDESGTESSTKSEDSSECEGDATSLVSTVEKIMKNLRNENAQLRRSLEESRSETEHLQSLTEKQARKLEENTLHIKELEQREALLTRNVEDLLVVIKQTEKEVSRWREACELEAEAGKNVIKERDTIIAIFKQEMDKTKAALNIANGKLRLKEELAEAAMAAQTAAERSLRLADSRAAEFRLQIEELRRQLEETEKQEWSKRRRVRHICWPLGILNFIPTTSSTSKTRNAKRMYPEMKALLH